MSEKKKSLIKKGENTDLHEIVFELIKIQGLSQTIKTLTLLEELRCTNHTKIGYISIYVDPFDHKTHIHFKELDVMKSSLTREEGDMIILYGKKETISNKVGKFFVLKKQLLADIREQYNLLEDHQNEQNISGWNWCVCQ
jgi:hypothetical protein